MHKQDEPFKEIGKQRPSDHAAKLRKQARSTPPGVARDRLIRRAQEAESASELYRWLNSSNLKSPT
jgi:hypothetical protein